MAPISTPSVAVVCGGRSAEAEVSRSSGRAVAEALGQRLPSVTTIEYGVDLHDRLREADVDVVFPVMHGPPGEDGTLQGFLETLGLPYVGSGVLASACAMHKPVAKAVFRAHGLPVAAEVVVARDEGTDVATARAHELGLPVVVKPVDQGSAVGVGFCHDEAALGTQVEDGFEVSGVLLIEELVPGRELTVAVVERDGHAESLPVVEITTPAGSWYDYEHRYTPGLSEHLIPAPVPEALAGRLEELGRRAHLALGCRDLSRADLVLGDDDEPVLLEVNTMPGMTPTSLYPDAARHAGIEFPDLVTGLARAAHARGAAAP